MCTTWTFKKRQTRNTMRFTQRANVFDTHVDHVIVFFLQVDHPKEDERCPDPSMVIDIWGYCR